MNYFCDLHYKGEETYKYSMKNREFETDSELSPFEIEITISVNILSKLKCVHTIDEGIKMSRACPHYY